MWREPGDAASGGDVSVVLCTWNRAAVLNDALAHLFAQDRPPTHEIIVVDNASTDATPGVLEQWTARHPTLRVIREPRQGLSFARNAGVAIARGRTIAFTDDDVRVGPSWLATLAATFARHPDAACAGGPVSPAWPGQVPPWLTERHWAPLGIQNYGDWPLRIDAARPLCLIGANLAIRRAALDRVGPFDPAVQRVADGSGSTEDQQWQLRLWESGGYGVYEPALDVTAVVSADRVAKPHHREWHFGHGRHVARMRLTEIEASRWRLFGVPAHLLRSAVADARDWWRCRLHGDDAGAFDREVRLWFAAGFLRERWG